MSDSRIDNAITRISAAMERISTAREAAAQKSTDAAGSAKVMALVNSHEKLREEVADTMSELDSLIEELEA